MRPGDSHNHFLRNRVKIQITRSHTILLTSAKWSLSDRRANTFLQLGKAYRTFIPPFCNLGKIMEIFLEVLVLFEREDDGNFVAILVDNVLFSNSHNEFLVMRCIHLMI